MFWSSTNLLLAKVSKVELWTFFNSSISLRLFSWASRKFQFCINHCAWRSCWSRRWSSSAWAQWSSSCWDSIISLNFCTLLRSYSAWNSCFLISARQSARICSLCQSKSPDLFATIHNGFPRSIVTVVTVYNGLVRSIMRHWRRRQTRRQAFSFGVIDLSSVCIKEHLTDCGVVVIHVPGEPLLGEPLLGHGLLIELDVSLCQEVVLAS